MRALGVMLETLETCARVLSVAGAWFVRGRRPENSTMAAFCSVKCPIPDTPKNNMVVPSEGGRPSFVR